MKSCFWGHVWGKWEEISSGDRLEWWRWEDESKAQKVGIYLYQKRVCERCGKLELDKQETHY